MSLSSLSLHSTRRLICSRSLFFRPLMQLQAPTCRNQGYLVDHCCTCRNVVGPGLQDREESERNDASRSVFPSLPDPFFSRSQQKLSLSYKQFYSQPVQTFLVSFLTLDVRTPRRRERQDLSFRMQKRQPQERHPSIKKGERSTKRKQLVH